jgi:putative Mn2+ efflux pump MntP
MNLSLLFFLNSVLLGVGLAMDAFSVSIANGLSEHKMGPGRMCAIAGVYGVFQALMPMLGWVCVHTILVYFEKFQLVIPWIALILLCYIGGKMLLDGIRGNEEEAGSASTLGLGTLLLQGVATSIDALSVGFTIAEYNAPTALLCSVIIAVVTFVICLGGLTLGKLGARASKTLSSKANILGGVILIAIGLEILISSFLG